MRTQLQQLTRRTEAGSAILMGLVVVAMATFGVAAWISLISARAAYIEGTEVAVKTRVSKLNARSIADEAIYQTVVTKASSLGGTLNLPANTGSILVPDHSIAPLASVSLPGGVARTGFANGYGYHIELPIVTTLKVDHDNDPVTTPINQVYTRNYLVKSRSPVLSGDLLVLHKPTVSPAETNYLRGNIHVFGNTVIWAAESPHWTSNKVRSDRFVTYTPGNPSLAVKVKSLADEWVPPSNYALTPTSGGDAGTAAGFDGTLDVIDPSPSVPWSVKAKAIDGGYISLQGEVAFDSGRGAESHGDGIIDIYLDDIHLGDVIIDGVGIDEINFYGQTTDPEFDTANLRGAITILIHETAGAADDLRINFHNRNNRRFLLAIKKDDGDRRTDFAFVNADDDPTWRMVWLAENSSLRIDDGGGDGQPNGTVRMIGGIRTDRYLRWSNDNDKILEIHRETDPKLLDRLDGRSAWIESFDS